MINVGVVGYGYWGPNLVRCFSEIEGCHAAMVCDLTTKNLLRAQRRHPNIKTTHNFSDLLNNPDIHAVAIATPVHSHYELALASLKAGKHVFIEKPMTETSEQAKELIDIAKQYGLVVMVDHTFIYTPAVKKIRDLIAAGDLGQIYFYDSTRVNLGLFQHDVSVIWDLAIHDLSILDFVLQDSPVAISATGATHLKGGVENSAFLTVFFDSTTVAHINVNWLAPVKLRQTLIGGSQKMILYDDLEVTEKIKIYDKGLHVENCPEGIHQVLKGYRIGDMYSPNLSSKEALMDELEHFVDCIEKNTTPITDGIMGLRMVQMLEVATSSMKQRGVPIEI